MSVPQPVTPTAGPELALRVVYMIVFAGVFWILSWTLAVVVILQLMLRLVNGRPHADVARFGASLGNYALQVIAFLTFVTETLPYPMSAWPADPP